MANFLSRFFGFSQPEKQNSHMRDDDISGRIYPAGSLHGITYDGEQDPAAMGDSIIYDVDYYTMAQRAYTLITINEFARIAISRLVQFAIGTGLKLHPEPLKEFLKNKFKIDLETTFTKDIKDLWRLFEDDKNASHNKQENIHGLAKIILYNAYIAGDVLVIKRVVNGNLQYQVINGLSVVTAKAAPENKDHKIIDGVEVDKSGVHVAYYVTDEEGKEERITARDSKGRLIAWLVYADDKRLGAVRGYSPLGVIMQKLHLIGRYSNSEVIAADTNAKFAAVIEQDKDSSGVNPLKGMPGIGRSMKKALAEIPAPNAANKIEVDNFVNKVKKIASGLFFHMPKGQKLSSFDTKRPNVNYTQFVDGSMKYNYASFGIPHEVALLLFQNNFSASRASLKMFEMVLRYVTKYTVIDNFYQIVYEQFFELNALLGNINAPKYLALKNDDGYLDNAFTKAKFISAKIPHIDEAKEANAVLAKIKGGLMTFEQGLEALGNMTDFDTLIERRKEEEEKIRAAGLKFETVLTPEITIVQTEGE